jgi:hypothetical protein
MKTINVKLALAAFAFPLALTLQTSATSAWGADTTTSTATPATSSDTTVSVKALLDAKVLDSTNRELGSLRGILADPQTGKLVRADIALKGSGGLLVKSDQQLSVSWDQVSIKRQEGNLVLVLNQEAIQKIQAIEKPQTQQKK